MTSDSRTWSSLVLLLCFLPGTAFSDAADAQPERDWAIREGFAIEVDTEGYRYPTAIAFVPEPGPAPDDPLYFVAELRGTVKVVTNDRQVRTFASDFFHLELSEELPAGGGEAGLAGLCLDADHGYLFVTYVYQDEEGVLRNNITRFSTRPHSFSLAPSGRLDFTEVLKPYRSALSHQIGPCLVEGDDLYLGIGDGHEPLASQDPNTLLGKIARLTLDGRPADGNPFRRRGASVEAAAYVYALGLRNPFGLVRAHDRLFFTDNGILSDRLAELERGRNYLWDGTDWSIAAAADLVFPTPVAPATLVYLDSQPPSSPKITGTGSTSPWLALRGHAAGAATSARGSSPSATIASRIG